MDQLRSLEAFVTVADTLSFAAAAKRLGVSKSVVTTRIQQLEDAIDSPLFHRSTRAVRLTEVGRAFAPECGDLLGKTARLVDRMRDMKGALRGVLRVHVLPGYAFGLYERHLKAFGERHPDIALEVTVSDAIIDPAREGFDCAIQIFEPVSADLVAKRLWPWRPVFCASPAYLAAHPAPRAPGDLRAHRIALYSRYPAAHVWEFRKGGAVTPVELDAVVRSTSVNLLRDFARGGSGIACLPTLIAAEDLLSGALVPVLRGYALPAFWLSAVYPSARASLKKLKLFLAELAAVPGDRAVPPWDRELIAKKLIAVR
jgi:DNA-binding transcriptional LysR family regulator